MEYRIIRLEEITASFLDGFDRYEEIKRAWRTENDIPRLKEIHYIESWDKTELLRVQEGLKKTMLNGGTVCAAFDKDVLVGFASLESDYFGSENQYIQLSMLHITRNYRYQGIGKVLFELCANKAKELGAKKLYISASSCENGQRFYKSMNCITANEVNQVLFELEPCDCQMEFIL